MSRWATAIHNGAGVPEEVKLVLERSLQVGRNLLRAGASAIDVVEAVVRELETGRPFNSGRAHELTRCGTVEMEASIVMDGRGLGCSAVSGVSTVENPVSLARRVMDKSPHPYLDFEGAEEFARVLVNDYISFDEAGNFNGGRKLHQILARGVWPNTFRLDRTTLGKPIGLVTRQKSWEPYVGLPMEQPVPGTCAIVACTACVEAVHRLEHDKLHGEGTFNRRAAVSAPDSLLLACHLDGTWMPREGAYVSEVLKKIQEIGGVPATTTAPATPCVLPLRSWQEHRWDDHLGTGLSPGRVSALMDSHGPCVGVFWVCPWYQHFDADRDGELVYRGCGRNEDDRELSKGLYGKDNVGSHAVVCIAYRFCGEEMHVLVRDNHDAAANGPQRWIDVEELDTLYTLSVRGAYGWSLDVDDQPAQQQTADRPFSD